MLDGITIFFVKSFSRKFIYYSDKKKKTNNKQQTTAAAVWKTSTNSLPEVNKK